MFRTKTLSLLAAPVLFLGLSELACSSDSTGGARRPNGPGGPGGAGGGMNGGGGGSAGVVGGGGGQGGAINVGMNPMNNFDAPDGSCAATRGRAEQIVETLTEDVTVEIREYEPVAIYLMLDRSGSMNIPSFPSLQILWPVAVGSISAFVADPSSEGIDVGLQYFPDPGQCDGALNANPAVGMGRLPGHANAITGSLNATAPFGGGTPIEAALRGGTQFCNTFQQQNAPERCINVLITDGAPTDCDTTIAGLTAIVDQACRNDNVITFAIGMDGADFNFMNSIAAAGSQPECYSAGQRNTAFNASAQQADFIGALNSIRDSVSTFTTHQETRQVTTTVPVACEFTIPPPPADEEFDKELVNVQFSFGTGTAQKVGFVENETDCASASGGWYYDDFNNPTAIKICPDTCAAVQATTNATVDVLLGCATEPAILR